MSPFVYLYSLCCDETDSSSANAERLSKRWPTGSTFGTVMQFLFSLSSAMLPFDVWALLDLRQARGRVAVQPVPRGEAGARVPSTFELLEYILLRLPMTDILFAQRVSKQVQSVIGNSLLLQRAVFFKPAMNITTNGVPVRPTLNPLLFSKGESVWGGICFTQVDLFEIWKAMNGLYQQGEEFMSLRNGGP